MKIILVANQCPYKVMEISQTDASDFRLMRLAYSGPSISASEMMHKSLTVYDGRKGRYLLNKLLPYR